MKILFYVTNEILKGVNGMEHNQYHDKIRKVAMDFDKAVESRNVIFILSSFTDNCEIELLGVKLIGKKGVEKWISWLYKHIVEIKFLPVYNTPYTTRNELLSASAKRLVPSAIPFMIGIVLIYADQKLAAFSARAKIAKGFKKYSWRAKLGMIFGKGKK